MNNYRTKPKENRWQPLVVGTVITLTIMFLAAFFPLSEPSPSLRASTGTSPSSDNAQAHSLNSVSLRLSSSAFANGSPIPAKYGYNFSDDGKTDISPPLEWSGVPPKTESLVLIVEDPDAPDPEHPLPTPWVHWVLYNISPSQSGLAEGGQQLPENTMMMQGLNDWKRNQYNGPSPPIGRHRYFFKLYALDQKLPNLGRAASRENVLQAMNGHVLTQAQLMGTFQKDSNR